MPEKIMVKFEFQPIISNGLEFNLVSVGSFGELTEGLKIRFASRKESKNRCLLLNTGNEINTLPCSKGLSDIINSCFDNKMSEQDIINSLWDLPIMADPDDLHNYRLTKPVMSPNDNWVTSKKRSFEDLITYS